MNEEKWFLRILLMLGIGYIVLAALEKAPDNRSLGEVKMIDGLLECGTDYLKDAKEKPVLLPPGVEP